MTCKDCLCSDVCIETRDQIQMLAYQSRNDVEKVCHNFKDKTRFVELPCKVGDIVYIISEGDIIPLYVGCIENNHRGISILGFNEEYFGNKTITLYPDKQIIKWFLTPEEAKKALKRSNGQ